MISSARIVRFQTDLRDAGFRDTSCAERNLARISELTSSAVVEALLPVLAGVADPDMAVNLYVRLAEEHPEAISSKQNAVALYYTATIVGQSQWLGETLIQSPDLLTTMLREKSVGKALSVEDYAERFARFRARTMSEDYAALLARFKRREYVRIMLRDVLGIATLSEVTAEISELTDVLIGEALRCCEQLLKEKYGPPQYVDGEGRLVDAGFAVLALGKHGGNELNYSSDIDLLFVFRDGEDPPGARISNREYFIRLAQELTAMLSRPTRDGAPFRIDLRLRPQGNEGEAAIGLSHALQYYSARAADWELQALIKLRYAAGDQKLAREFIRRVQPLVYTEQLNFAAIETAVLSGERIQRHRRRSISAEQASVDVKLDPGGIRDIEFLVQCLQRVYGGREKWLRSGGTMFSLQKLHDKGHISGRDFHELTTAYEFLRTIEHRLQVRSGQQVHKLPTEAERLLVLARGVAPRLVPSPSTELLRDTLCEHMTAVRRIYDRIIHQQQVSERAEHDEEWRLRTAVPAGREASEQEILQRLAMDAPEIYRKARQDFAPHVRARVFRFLSATFTSPERYTALLDSRSVFDAALDVMSASDYLTELLVRHPEEIARLAEIGTVRRVDSERLIAFSGGREGRSYFVDFLARLGQSPAEKLSLIRQRYRSQVFASGARDVLLKRCVYDSLAETTAIAEESIAAAISLLRCPAGLAVFALGRLGSGEFDILSDADLVFVREESLDVECAATSVAALVQALSAYTRDGTLFPVDARLRPHGSSGSLVVTPAELLRYFEAEAEPWEALTWTKLRSLHGPAGLRERVFSAAGALFQRFATSGDFVPALRHVRERLERSAELENLRTGPGGLYDLDFIAGSLLVRLPGEARFGGNIGQRLQVLCEIGALTMDDCTVLSHGAELLRSTEHAMRLATGLARKTLPRSERARESVEGLVRESTGAVDVDLETALRAARAQIRDVFARLLQ